MSLLKKLEAQHKKSVAKMKEARQDMQKAKQDIKKAWEEVKSAGSEEFNEAKEQLKEAKETFKKEAGQEIRNTMENIKEVWTKKCPNCNSTEVKKHKQKAFGFFMLALFVMIFGTIFLGFVGFLIGSLLMIIPGWRMLKNSFSSNYHCTSCGHIFKA